MQWPDSRPAWGRTRRWWPSRTGPARSRPWSAVELQRATLQPRHQRTSPARLSFKPFILLRALSDGIDPNSVWASSPAALPGQEGAELFKVSNYEDSYLGSASLWSATAASDNSVFAELGMKVKPGGWPGPREPDGDPPELSTNPAMLLGGLEQGVTPLEMATRLLDDRQRRRARVRLAGPERDRAGGLTEVEGKGFTDENRRREKRVFLPRSVSWPRRCCPPS